MKCNVGELRQQIALSPPDEPVEAVIANFELQSLLGGRKLSVVSFYPDTTDSGGEWSGTFKVEIGLK